MEICANSINEYFVEGVRAVDKFHIENDGSNIVLKLVLILRQHKIGNFTSVQNIVNVLEESFGQDLRISQCKCS